MELAEVLALSPRPWAPREPAPASCVNYPLQEGHGGAQDGNAGGAGQAHGAAGESCWGRGAAWEIQGWELPQPLPHWDPTNPRLVTGVLTPPRTNLHHAAAGSSAIAACPSVKSHSPPSVGRGVGQSGSWRLELDVGGLTAEPVDGGSRATASSLCVVPRCPADGHWLKSDGCGDPAFPIGNLGPGCLAALHQVLGDARSEWRPEALCLGSTESGAGVCPGSLRSHSSLLCRWKSRA